MGLTLPLLPGPGMLIPAEGLHSRSARTPVCFLQTPPGSLSAQSLSALLLSLLVSRFMLADMLSFPMQRVHFSWTPSMEIP